MHRRFLFPLAAGVLGLVAIAPVLVSGPSALAVGSDRVQATTSSTASDPASDSDPDADPDADADTDQGTDPGTDPDRDSGADSGSDSTGPGRDSGTGTTGTTAPRSGSGSGGGSSSATCDPPVTDRGPAPQVGEPAQTYEAGEAGTVDVERLSDSELRIAGASPNDGWTEEVRGASGPRVNVRFTRQGQSPSLIRFAASMDQKGTEIHVRVTSCG